MSSRSRPPATTDSSTLYFGPWYRRSPFFEKTLEAGCSAYDIYNHMYLPGYYADPIEEYWALLNDVTVWDVSVERIVEITGPDASAFTNTLTCRDLTKCAVGQGKYVLDHRRGRRHRQRPGPAPRRGEPLVAGAGRLRRRACGRAASRSTPGMDVTVREPEVYPVQVQGPKSKDVDADALRRRHRRHQVLLDAHDRARRHPGRHQPDRLDRRGRLRDLPARPVARRRPVGPASWRPASRTTSGRSRRARRAGSRPASSTTART